ncbi:hypothetical protein J6590_057143 [Homalodisca vitripennis]|nr:hypothetical protein J6590_057143 [Homalodisca vitripennis]
MLNAMLRQEDITRDETVQGEGGAKPGKIYVPSSFTGGPRYMKIHYEIDSVIRADIPSVEEPGGRLRKLVLQHMKPLWYRISHRFPLLGFYERSLIEYSDLTCSRNTLILKFANTPLRGLGA